MNDDAPAPITDAELHAWVDAQLDPARVPALLAWLQSHPDDAARVSQWQLQRLQLRQMARAMEVDGSVGDVPPALTEVVMRQVARSRRRAGWRQAAAAVVLLASGLAAGLAGGRWWAGQEALSGRGWAGGAGGSAARALAASPSFVREAVTAHAVFVPEKRHPVEVAASDEAHLVQWLSRRLGAPLKAPLLVDRGYRLLGGRLLAGDEGVPRAQFMYEDAQGGRITLFVTVFGAGKAPAQTSFRSVKDGTRESFYWVEDRYGYALSGEVPAAELQALARTVYEQLTR